MIHALASDPDLFARVKADRTLIRPLIEEVLRLEAPVQGFFRILTADTELSGVVMPKGSMVYLRYGAANRDPALFEDADSISLSRRNGTQHLTFGGGIHHCIGQMLARKELACAIDTLCTRTKSLRVEPDQDLDYVLMFNRRALTALRIGVTREDQP